MVVELAETTRSGHFDKFSNRNLTRPASGLMPIIIPDAEFTGVFGTVYQCRCFCIFAVKQTMQDMFKSCVFCSFVKGKVLSLPAELKCDG